MNNKSNKSADIKGIAKKVGVFLIRPSFTKDNWNPGKGATDILNHTKLNKKVRPVKYEDICAGYGDQVDSQNSLDISSMRRRKNMILLVLFGYSSLGFYLYEPGGVFQYLFMDLLIFGVPTMTLIAGYFVLDFFLSIAVARRSISFTEYVMFKVKLNGK